MGLRMIYYVLIRETTNDQRLFRLVMMIPCIKLVVWVGTHYSLILTRYIRVPALVSIAIVYTRSITRHRFRIACYHHG